jgi:hypothetical protein
LQLGLTERIEQAFLKCGFETNPGVPGFSFGTKWNQTGTGDVCKLLKTWWPGTELVNAPALIPRNLRVPRTATTAEKAKTAASSHVSGTLS